MDAGRVMRLEITTTPRETLVWAPTAQDAARLREFLTAAGRLVLDATPDELAHFGYIPDDERDLFDPARIFDIEIGAEAHDSFEALVGAGHALVWHRWQSRRGGNVWGETVYSASAKPKRAPMDSAVHFGIKVRASQKYGLRLVRDEYARINKRSSMPRRTREMDPEFWDYVDERYEDAEHRIYTDEWCEAERVRALENYDLNMAHFASLDPDEFERVLQHTVKSWRGMVEVTDLTKWDRVPGLYVMVLDDYRQVYVGVTSYTVGIMTRIRQHWNGTKQFDRLLWPDVETSIMSIDSFRPLDTTRIFAFESYDPHGRENELLEKMPSKFALNRIMGGPDALRFAALLGVEKVIKTRDPLTAIPEESA
ncbi:MULTISPECIES: hypothetical protein [unclassified Microbacterium]|uniref:hypothetical protein n=1 Tax=unclassified Microbacterium TaxID=2609290 RepID=UPI00366831FE